MSEGQVGAAPRRRSQSTRMNWERFQRLVYRYIPSCRVLHAYPEERFFGSHPTLSKNRMRQLRSYGSERGRSARAVPTAPVSRASRSQEAHKLAQYPQSPNVVRSRQRPSEPASAVMEVSSEFMRSGGK